MEQPIPQFNLNLQVVGGDIDNLQLIDELNANHGHTQQEIITKYLNDLHEELSQRGDSTSPELAKTILIEVVLHLRVVPELAGRDFHPRVQFLRPCQ